MCKYCGRILDLDKMGRHETRCGKSGKNGSSSLVMLGALGMFSHYVRVLGETLSFIFSELFLMIVPLLELLCLILAIKFGIEHFRSDESTDTEAGSLHSTVDGVYTVLTGHMLDLFGLVSGWLPVGITADPTFAKITGNLGCLIKDFKLYDTSRKICEG